MASNPTLPPHTIAVARELVPSLSKVEGAPEREHYWRVLLRLWGSPRSRGHPGCNPVSLGRTRLPDLDARRYGIALKSDGVRYALLLTLRPKHTPDAPAPVALMIDRAKNMYEVEVVAPEAYFARGTVLEGELVWREPRRQQMLYLVFDAVCVRGESLLALPFEERLRRAEACTRWSEEIAADADDDVEARVAETDSVALVHYEPSMLMRPKHFVSRDHAARLWNERRDCEHRVDGIVLMDLDSAYVRGTAEDGVAYKWKHGSSVDLELAADGLRAADGPLPTRVHGRTVRADSNRVSETAAAQGVRIVEYHLTVTDAEVALLPTRTRPDKAHANGIRVIEATVRDVLDAVQVEELCGGAEGG